MTFIDNDPHREELKTVNLGEMAAFLAAATATSQEHWKSLKSRAFWKRQADPSASWTLRP